MAKRNAEKSYNTNLASEYLVMSLLSRTGKDAYLSLGNKKGVDIIVTAKNGQFAIVEVKGVNKKSDDWLVGSSGKFNSADNMLYALISFESQITNVTVPAEFWVIPSTVLAENHKVSNDGKTVYISHKFVKESFDEYKNTFQALEVFLEME
jgi:hypothetical protein